MLLLVLTPLLMSSLACFIIEVQLSSCDPFCHISVPNGSHKPRNISSLARLLFHDNSHFRLVMYGTR